MTGIRLISNKLAAVMLNSRSLFGVLRTCPITRPNRVHVMVDPTVTKENTTNSTNISLVTVVALLV